jgi:hypothetical protein
MTELASDAFCVELHAALLTDVIRHGYSVGASGVPVEWDEEREAETIVGRYGGDVSRVLQVVGNALVEGGPPSRCVLTELVVDRVVPDEEQRRRGLVGDDVVHIAWKYRCAPTIPPTSQEQDKNTLELIARLARNRGRIDSDIATALMTSHRTSAITPASIVRVSEAVHRAIGDGEYSDPDI